MKIALSIVIALFCPLAALMAVLSPVAVQLLAEATVVAPTAAEKAYLVSIALAVRDYSLGNDAAALPHGADYRTAMPPDALAHLLDVRVVFIACEVGFVVVTLALIALIVIVIRRREPVKEHVPLTGSFIIGGIIPLAAAALLAAAVAIDFNAFFSWMHSLFFAAGTWTFPADSLLIRSLPEQFWLDCALLWAASMIVLCLIAIFAGLVLRRTYRSRPLTISRPSSRGAE